MLNPVTGLLTTVDGTLQAFAAALEVNVGLQYFGTPSYILSNYQSIYYQYHHRFPTSNTFPPQTCVLSSSTNEITCVQNNDATGRTIVIDIFEYCTGNGGSLAFDAIHNCDAATLTAVNIVYP